MECTKYKKYLYYIFVFMKKCWLIVANSYASYLKVYVVEIRKPGTTVIRGRGT